MRVMGRPVVSGFFDYPFTFDGLIVIPYDPAVESGEGRKKTPYC